MEDTWFVFVECMSVCFEDSPIMHPPKNKAWTSPILYLWPQTKPHSDTVDPPAPPTHSQDPASNPQTVRAATEHPDPPSTHRQSGSRSANIITIVWKASKAQAKLVRTKCFNCQGPNSPQYLCNISSIPNFRCPYSPAGFLAGDISGDSRPEEDGEGDMGIWNTNKGQNWEIRLGLEVCYS